jgi:hypothetical protein
MGYVRAHLKLEFDDPELAGFVVRAKRLSIGRLMDLMELRSLKGLGDDSPEVREGLQQIFVSLSKVITSWNLEEPVDPADPDGPSTPVPVTPETIADQDFGLLVSIIDALQSATTAVSRPLAQPSSDGDPSLVASIPMDELSPNPES